MNDMMFTQVDDYPTEDVFGTEILPGDVFFKFGEDIVLSQNIDDYLLEHLNVKVLKAK
ncbi:YqaI family protein [Ureibacillus sp. FSL W8-0352]|uniref:YqaI family protein n=1 Tax=Ureibacillus sp. FSL W8-0352 TaxID=2954596 RepID=UPI0030FA6B45